MLDTVDIDEIVENLNEIIPGLDLILTVKGDELKGWTRDTEGGGTRKFYLNAADCRNLAAAFLKIADNMKEE